MLKKIFLGVVIVVVIFAAYFGYVLAAGKILSPFEKVELTHQGTKISVDYSRPYKKERKIFGGLVPYGKYWRTGANEATEISFSRDVHFGDAKVRAGRYWLYTIPDKSEWVIVLNSELGAWGVPGPDLELDVVRVTAPSNINVKEVEQFEISLMPNPINIELKLSWDKSTVTIPISPLK